MNLAIIAAINGVECDTVEELRALTQVLASIESGDYPIINSGSYWFFVQSFQIKSEGVRV